MNRYRNMLEKKLYNMSLVTNNHGKMHYHNNMTQHMLSILVQKSPDDIVHGGSINGTLISTYRQSIMHTGCITVKQLNELLPVWLNDDVLVPELYVVGGYYPTKNGEIEFALQRHSRANDDFYMWTKQPWTDLPVYRIDDTKFTRVKEGELSSPSTYPIKTWFDNIIRRKIQNNDFINV